MRSIVQDLRYALRQLRRAPGFTFTAITVLALGLGANIAVFTVLNGVLLRPLPYAHSDRLVSIGAVSPIPYFSMSYADMLQLRDATGIEAGTAFATSNASIAGPGGRAQVLSTETDAGLMKLLGVQPILGRTFRADEDDPGRSRVLLVGEDVWRSLYHADPAIVGKTLSIRGTAYTIIGVMPRTFSFPFGEAMEIWSPAAITPANRSAMHADDSQITGSLIARLPDGMSVQQLTAALDHAQALIAKEVPSGDLPTRVNVTSYQQTLNDDARKPLWLLYAVVLGIWALACLNVTSLVLARAIARTREQAVRAVLGASGRRLLQQSLVESLLLSSIGALAGLLLGESAIKLLWSQLGRHLPLYRAVHVDWRVAGFLFLLTCVTALLVGGLPAWRAARRDVQMRLPGVTSTASATQNRMREGLVVAQLALTLVFLTGAGLFLRTIDALRHVPLGFTQQNVLTGGIIVHPYSSDAAANAPAQANVVQTMYMPLLQRVQSIPGVQVAALSSVLPLRAEFAVKLAGDLDHRKTSFAETPVVDGRLASAGLTEALGIPMMKGRFFTAEDTTSSPVVIVVNQAFVNKYLRGQDPIGHSFSMGKGRYADSRIVGVIGDTKQGSLTSATTPEIYFCLAQVEPNTPLYGVAVAFIQVAIRASVPADSLRAQFDRALHEVAPDATTTDVKTIHEAVEDSFGSQALIARLLEGFAAIALMIASVGLYGLLSFAVAQRTHEIGVRMALGALRINILSLILRRALLLVVAGLAFGTIIAWFASNLARSYIFGVQAHDAFTIAAVACVLAAAALLAAWLPARRAASVEPMQALRAE
jgi:predicted permease